MNVNARYQRIHALFVAGTGAPTAAPARADGPLFIFTGRSVLRICFLEVFDGEIIAAQVFSSFDQRFLDDFRKHLSETTSRLSPFHDDEPDAFFRRRPDRLIRSSETHVTAGRWLPTQLILLGNPPGSRRTVALDQLFHFTETQQNNPAGRNHAGTHVSSRRTPSAWRSAVDGN